MHAALDVALPCACTTDLDILPPLASEPGCALSPSEATWLLANRTTVLQLWQHIRDSVTAGRVCSPAHLERLTDDELLDAVIRSRLFLQGDGATDRRSLLELSRQYSVERWRKIYNDGRRFVEFLQRADVYDAGPSALWGEVSRAGSRARPAADAVRLGIRVVLRQRYRE